jgi:sugar phosphate isomerase/epimerase
MGFDRLGSVREMGYDYLEGNATVLAGMSPEAFDETRCAVDAAGMPVLAFNCLFPGQFQFFDPAVTDATLSAHLRTVFEREAALGGKVSVFGSGGPRRFPEGVPYAEACHRVVSVLRLAGDAAAPHGITVVFEPLRPAETNIGNTVCEGALLVQMADHPNVRLLADYYHMASVGEPMTEIGRVGGVRHAHIATREGRYAPLVAGSDDFAGFFRELQACGCETVSIEGALADFNRDAPRALALLRAIGR